MDAAQRQHFNDKGWLVVPGVLGTDLLSRLNPVYDAELRSSWDGKVLAHGWANSGSARPAAERLAGRVLWGEAMYELINPPKLVPILEQLLGEPELGHALPGGKLQYPPTTSCFPGDLSLTIVRKELYTHNNLISGASSLTIARD